MNRRTRLQRCEKAIEPIIVDRERLDGVPFIFPEPTFEQWIECIDAARIPEYLEAANGGYAHNERGWYPSKEYVDHRVAWCNQTLAMLESHYTHGDIDAETYSRLTTKQRYSEERLRELKAIEAQFVPSKFGIALPRSDGRQVSMWTLRGSQGESIMIWRVGNEWLTYPDDLHPNREPGW